MLLWVWNERPGLTKIMAGTGIYEKNIKIKVEMIMIQAFLLRMGPPLYHASKDAFNVVSNYIKL